MKFKDDGHKEKYFEILAKMNNDSCYHRAVAYLLALDENISHSPKRIAECFDFAEGTICPSAIEEPWVTGFDCRVLKLAFNLWNSTPADISEVFDYGDIEYLSEAIKIRYER